MIDDPELAQRVDERTVRLVDPTRATETIEAVVDIMRGTSSRDLLFRGQPNSGWNINSTFARREDIKASVQTPQGVVDAYSKLAQMLAACVPSEELLILERNYPASDPDFELLRDIRQYPEKPEYFGASNVAVEWLTDWKKALAFLCDEKTEEGCLFVLDHHALGPIFKPRGLNEVQQAILRAVQEGRLPRRPYILHPEQQPLPTPRVERQQPILMIQADITVGLEVAFETLEREFVPAVISYRRILVPAAMKPAIQAHLAAEGITLEWLMDRTTATSANAHTHETPR